MSGLGGLLQGGLVRGGGAWSRGVPGPGGLLLRGLVWGVPGGSPPTATAVGSMHPTGMHSCSMLNCITQGHTSTSVPFVYAPHVHW